MRTSNSLKMKNGWIAAEQMAVIINKVIKGTPHALNRVLSKMDVHAHLLTKCRELGLIDRIIAGDDAAVFELVASPAWEIMVQKFAFKLVKADEGSGPPHGSIVNDKGETIRPGDAIRLAMWYIDKVGGFDNAKKALAVAGQSITMFSKKK